MQFYSTVADACGTKHAFSAQTHCDVNCLCYAAQSVMLHNRRLMLQLAQSIQNMAEFTDNLPMVIINGTECSMGTCKVQLKSLKFTVNL